MHYALSYNSQEMRLATHSTVAVVHPQAYSLRSMARANGSNPTQSSSFLQNSCIGFVKLFAPVLVPFFTEKECGSINIEMLLKMELVCILLLCLYRFVLSLVTFLYLALIYSQDYIYHNYWNSEYY